MPTGRLVGSLLGCFVLGSHKLWIIDKSILVVVVRVQNRVNQCRELVVRKDLILVGRLVLGFAFLVPVDERLDQLAAVQLVVVVRVVHFEVVELQLLFTHLAGVDRHFHVLGNVLLLVLDVVRVEHLLGLPMMLLMLLLLLLQMGLSLRMALNRNLLLMLNWNLLRLLVLRLYGHLLLLILGLLLIVLLLGDRRLLLVVLLRLLVLLLLILARIYAGGNALTKCHRCKQRQG